MGRLMWGALDCSVRDCGIFVGDCGVIVRDGEIIEPRDAPVKHRRRGPPLPCFIVSVSDLVRTMANIVLRRANQKMLVVSICDVRDIRGSPNAGGGRGFSH
jgi:hypothetical protein